MTEITFDQTGDFAAVDAACNWLTEHGYSVGSMCGHMPMGILKGDWIIAKWRNLTPKERNQLDGKLISNDFRNGPIVVQLKEPAVVEPQINKQVNLMDQFIADGGFDQAFNDVFGLPESVKQSLKEVP